MPGAAFPSLSTSGAAFPRLSSHGSLTEPVESSISSLGTFWHVTDWHLNEFAPPNASARDLCRSAARAGDEQPGAFGHPDCDPSADLWELALARMAALAPSPDFVFAGGDWLGHVAEGRMSGAAETRQYSSVNYWASPRPAMTPEQLQAALAEVT